MRNAKLEALIQEQFFIRRSWSKARVQVRVFCHLWADAHEALDKDAYYYKTKMIFLDGVTYELGGVCYGRQDFTTAEIGLMYEILTSL
jgi:hypothetical protein